MKKILTFISGTALTAAAVIAVIALTAGGQASAQDAPPSDTATAVENTGPLDAEAVSSLTGIADKLIDSLEAQGVITEDQATEARSALEDAEAQLEATDWDMVETQVELGIARLKREIENADWDDIRKQMEDAIAEFDGKDFEEFDFDLDSIDWTELEKGFDRFKGEVGQFDLDQAKQELEKHLGEVDWDDLSSKFSEGIEEFDFDSFKDRVDELKQQFEGMDWDALRDQFEGQF